MLEEGDKRNYKVLPLYKGITPGELEDAGRKFLEAYEESISIEQAEMRRANRKRIAKKAAIFTLIVFALVYYFAKNPSRLSEDYFFKTSSGSYSISYSDKQEIDDDINDYQKTFEKFKGDIDNSHFLEEKKVEVANVMYEAAKKGEIPFREAVIALARLYGKDSFSGPLDEILSYLSTMKVDDLETSALFYSGNCANYFGSLGYSGYKSYWQYERENIYATMGLLLNNKGDTRGGK